ncbi:MAG: hypothetical protein IKH03_04375 [Oscillospiraceae bacterium]|nr:hypothetical protein [Oscillospiraceae bacterium]
MDDNNTFSGGQPTGTQSRKAKLRRLLAGLATLLLVLSALLVFALRDRLSSERLRETFGQGAENTIQSEPYTYEVGTGQVFAVAGNGFAVASSSALEYLDRDGRALYKQLVSYSQPAVFASASGVLFCDLGTEKLVWLDAEGKPRSLSPAGEVLTASMNARGYVALVTAEAGYKAKVTVYDATAKARYEWWSGSGYVLAARVSPDCRVLAALCAEESGGTLHLFRLDSETELASAAFPGELPFDLDFLGNDSLCAVGQTGMSFLGLDGALRERFDFGDYYLMDYEFGESFAACYVSAYRGGGGGFLETFSPAGELLAVKEQERDILSLSASGRSLLAMSGGGWTVYSPELNVQRASASLLTARRALLRADGSILLLGAYAAERVR